MARFTWRLETDRAVLGGMYLEVAEHYNWADLLYELDAERLPTWMDWVGARAHVWAAYDSDTGRLGGYAIFTHFMPDVGGTYSCWAHFCRLPHVPERAALAAGRTFLQAIYLTTPLHTLYIHTRRAAVARFAGLLGFEVRESGGEYHGWRRRRRESTGSQAGGGASGGGDRHDAGGRGQRAAATGASGQPRIHLPDPDHPGDARQEDAGSVAHTERSTQHGRGRQDDPR